MLALTELKAKSLKNLSGLIPVVAAAAERLIERAYYRGIQIIITQGYRSIAEQNALYAQGRTKKFDENGKPLSIVTKAKGGSSFHNYGVAIDFALLLVDGRTASWDTKRDDDRDGKADWMEVVEEAKALGFEWGGDWTTFTDLPHFQMCFGLTIADYRAGKLPPAALVSEIYAKLNPVQEEDDTLQLTNYEWSALETKIKALLDQGKMNDVAWLEKAKNRTLTVSELAWLGFMY